MKKNKLIVFLISIVLALIVGGFFLSVWLGRDTSPPKLPTKSERDTLILASNGCCFWVEDVDVYLRDNRGKSILLSHNDAIYEYDIFKYEISDFSEDPIELVIAFRSFYGDKVDFSMSVMDFENINALKEAGVLLYFQESDDMYLNVIIGNYHASYKMGSPENHWIVMDEPNKVYSN